MVFGISLISPIIELTCRLLKCFNILLLQTPRAKDYSNSLGGNIRHPQSRTTDETRTHASTEATTQARVMIDRELLISLHQKVDSNHDWVKRQFSDILSYMTHMHSSVKKVHQYAHHTYQHLEALMK